MGDNDKDASKVAAPSSTPMPIVEFVEDVDAFMNLPDNKKNAELVLSRMDELLTKAKIIDMNNRTAKARLKSQIQELQNCIKMIHQLKKNKQEDKTMSSHFRLADHLFAKAKVPPTEKIGLWLGAHVMLEYDLETGESLLKSKKETAESSLCLTQKQIDTIREDITTIEVNMARVYNWDVKLRQAEKNKLGTMNNSNDVIVGK